MKLTITVAIILVLAAVANALTEEQIQQVLDAHNTERALVGVGPVSYNMSIEKIAQTFVDTCPGDHSGADGLGENLYWSTVQDVAAAVVSWSSEKQYWDCETNRCCEGGSCSWYPCGHYTQVVWADTTQIGCGAKQCSKWYTVVCNYYRPGNYNCEPFCDRPFPKENCPVTPVVATPSPAGTTPATSNTPRAAGTPATPGNTPQTVGSQTSAANTVLAGVASSALVVLAL